MSKRIYLCFLLGFIAVLCAYTPSYSAAGDSGEVETPSAGLPYASDSAEVAASSPSGSDEVSASAPADSSEVSSAPASPAGGPLHIDAGEISADITKLLSGNKKIFFLEQMAALKMSNEGGSEVEGTLNALYDSRESLSMKLAGLAVRDGSGRALKIIKGRILGTKLYELYGLDSFTSYALNHPEFPEGSDGTAAVSAASTERLKDSLLELKSFIELENSRVVNSNSFISELDNYMASLKDGETSTGASDGGGPGQDGGFSGEESKVLFSVQEVSPGANSTDASIDSPITVKFDAGKFAGAKNKIAVNVRTVNVGQKYSKPASGDTGAIKFKWDAAFSLLTITAAAHLQRNALYNVLLVFDHKIPAPAKRKTGEDSPQKGFFRDRSVNAGLFKTIDVDLGEMTVKYSFDWNFTTQSYESTSSEAALSSAETSATEETELGDNSTAEVDLKDKRGTEENEIGDKAAAGKNGTAENAVNKKGSIMGEVFEQPQNMPMLVNRSPEGVSIMSASEIFVIFSCDIDPKSINNDTMQLFYETSKSEFEKLQYKLKLDGRRLTLIPKTPLSASKNYKVTVNSVRTAKKLNMPINETFHFKTACAVMGAKLSRGQKDKKEETLEITISEDLADLNINFFEIEKKKEKPVEFDKCGKIFAEPRKPVKPAIVSLALGAGKNAAPSQGDALKTPGSRKAQQNKIIKPQGPVTILLKPKVPLVKGREYKIDVFSTGGVIENGIIKFTAK
ncbi:MAG: hypothetical protein A2008_10230 [Candidatus Wallbacteria bacterium GWC2_49_35]|uniref:SbsA Ig-like domain-containing protein n=1 Tax=Candidatus Wallbacteria bacterium GWC2_49_35 TaxID=1817813 RepID=A0A1F7WYR3_9BACT|nr:MAG: hypothetical protein A2008_10230 [Candidatus Wallbacteria bacterium GWC2_49_35]HBC76348.1 hypothetical protein [Candidatus Wallbacteria bacterium]